MKIFLRKRFFNIFYCSVVGHSIPWFGKPMMNVYGGSKYAVTALTETLRQELNYHQSKIKVTVSLIFKKNRYNADYDQLFITSQKIFF